MEPKTLEALNASIAKWEKNTEASTPSEYLIGIEECALCIEFHPHYTTHSEPYCSGCPVKEATGFSGCQGTPYCDADDAHDEWENWPDDEEYRDAARECAIAEVAFLKSLLPTSPTS